MVKVAGENPRNTLLSRLPKLSEIKPLPFTIPTATTPKGTFCVNCDQNLKNDSEFSQSVKVCRACLKTYAKIDSALNFAAEQKAIEARKMKFQENLRSRGIYAK